MPHVYPHAPKPGRGTHRGGNGAMGGSHRKDGCCSYEMAGRAVLRGRGRLAVRYIRMDIKARLGVIGSRRLGTI